VRRGPALALLTDLREEALHAEADALERGGEEQGVLVAIPAAFPFDQLRLQGVQVEPNRAPEDDVEFSKGIAARCARWSPNNVGAVGSVSP
jgi:hypothetical protein